MAGDYYWPSTSLLLIGEGANGSTVFTDSSASPKTATLVGTPTISTAQSRFNTSSMLFDGTTDALTFPHSTDLNLASGDFTIEAWVFLTSLATSRCILQKDQTYGSTYPSCNFDLQYNGSLHATVGTGTSAPTTRLSPMQQV